MGAASWPDHYWPMNEESGSTVYDKIASGTKRNGTISKAKWVEDGEVEALFTGLAYMEGVNFTLRNIETGSERFTNSNEVEIVGLMVPPDYDCYQITLVDDIDAIDPEGRDPSL